MVREPEVTVCINCGDSLQAVVAYYDVPGKVYIEKMKYIIHGYGMYVSSYI